MARKLFDDRLESPISPLIDVVMNGLAAMFILLMIYAVFVPTPKPVRFLADVPPPPVISGQQYVFTFPVVDGTGKRHFFLTGALPPALQFEPNTGTIYGVPNRTGDSGNFPLQVAVRDDAGQDTRTATLSLYSGAHQHAPDARPLQISRDTEELAPGRVGVPYETVLGATDGIEPYIWRIVSGGLPAGLTLEAGRITGTPQRAGVFHFEVRVGHTQGSFSYRGQTYLWAAAEHRRVYRCEIFERLPHVLYLPVGRVGEPYLGIVLTNGTVPGERVRWTAQVPGLQTSDRERVLRGIPSEPGVFQVAYQFSSAGGQTETGAGEVHILAARRNPLTLEIPPMIVVAVGRPGYASPVYVHPAVSGGSGIYAWDLESQLPPDLTFSVQSGVLTGRLASAGTWNLEMRVRDLITRETIAGSTILRGVYIDDSQPRFVTTSLPTAIAGTAFEFAFAVAGGIGVPRFSFQGSLPEGLIFTDAGIAGTPTRSGVAEFEVTVTDAVEQPDGPKTFTLQVEEVDRTRPTLVTTALPPAVPGLPYTQALAAEGGFGAYTWTLRGELPPQLAFTSNGMIQGRLDPMAHGNWPLQVVVQDAKGQSTPPQDFALRIDAGWPALTLESTPLPPAIQDAPYHTRLVAHSCWGICTWSMTGLPAGLELTRGAIVGTPHQAGTYALAVTASDGRGRQATNTYTLQVLAPIPSPQEPQHASSLFQKAITWLGGVAVMAWLGVGLFFGGKWLHTRLRRR